MNGRTLVVVNARSGGLSTRQKWSRLKRALEWHGLEADVQLIRSGRHITDAIADGVRQGVGTIAIGGGDGTMCAAAAHLAGTNQRMGVLPMGTFNYFARNLGIPMDLAEAVGVLTKGYERQISIGDVNGKPFLNNASLGMYSRILEQREHLYKRRGRSQIAAYASILLSVVRVRTSLSLQVTVDGTLHRWRTPMVFVANNRFQLEAFNLAGADCLEQDYLALYVAPDCGRLSLLMLSIGLAFGWLRPARDFKLLCGREILVESQRTWHHLVRDGERESLAGPYRLQLRKDALRVLDLTARAGSLMRTVVHVSDLHFGRTRSELLAPLLKSIAAAQPDLVVVSGDLTQRARVDQFVAARHFLAALPQPLLVVPGNHDLPLEMGWTRLFSPWRRYRQWIDENLEPCFEDKEICVVSVNTVAPFLWERGWIARNAVERACALLGRMDGRTRIVVTHHPFVHAPESAGKALMHGAASAIRSFARCGADIVLSGHLHRWRAEPYRASGSAIRSVLLVQAGSGLSTRVRGHENDYSLLRIEPGAVTVRRFATSAAGTPFQCVAERSFIQSEEGWIILRR